MNFFEQELYSILDGTLKDAIIYNKTFVGKIDDTLRAKVYWYETHIKDNYDALMLKIINRIEGEVDRVIIKFSDVWGSKKARNGFTIYPHIWVGDNKSVEWYAYQPTDEDKQKIREIIENYINIYR